MSTQRCIKMNPKDNVAIAVKDIPQGVEAIEGVVTLEPIPQGHKVALRSLAQGEAVVRYGVVLGYAVQDIPQGAWIHESLLHLPEPPDVHAMAFGTSLGTDLPRAPVRSFMGYRHPSNPYAGTRNLLAIHTTVQCVTGVLNVAVERIRRELLPKYPHVDGVVPIHHAYGCGVALDGREAKVPIRTLRNLIHQPNFGGEVMTVALGCEKFTVDMLLDEADRGPENVIALQDLPGFAAMVEAILAMADRKLARLNKRRREALPLSALMVGMQCGGSDAFSGVSANPSAGYATDLLVEAGATVLFSEVTEVRDGVHLLAQRCADQETLDKLAVEMVWYDDYLAAGGVDRSANPTPGNKKGGLSNIVEKAMGSIAKSGVSPIVEVLSPGQRPSRQGLIFAATPASDFVCGPCQLASGMGLQVFMTGRGTPYGLAAAPVIKVSSRSEMKALWPDLIDIDAGPVATGDATIEEVGLALFHEIIAVANGEKKPFAEAYGLHNDLCVFNPAPIT